MPDGAPSPLAQPADARHRFDELDGLRGIAALAIVVFHAYQHARAPFASTVADIVLSSLDAGVDLFFVLSGFVIFLPFARASLDGTQAPSIRTFIARRAARILPLYYALFLTVWAIRYTGYPGQITDLWQHLTFTHVFDAERIFWTIGPAWSIANEVIYYIGVALVAVPLHAACRRASSRRVRLMVVSAVPVLAIAASVAWKADAYASGIPFDHWPTYFGPVARLDGFAFGMGLAIAVAALSRHPRRDPGPAARWRGVLLTVAGAGTVVAAAYLRTGGGLGELYFHSLSGLGFLAILASFVLPGGSASPGASWLRSGHMVRLGALSYGVYLWHEPLLIELTRHELILGPGPEAFLANAVILPLLALGAAACTYSLLERPGMALAARRTPRPATFQELPAGTPASGAVPPPLLGEPEGGPGDPPR